MFSFTTNNVSGGAGRDRTDDLMLAKHALSQLSYSPLVAVTARYRYQIINYLGKGNADGGNAGCLTLIN